METQELAPMSSNRSLIRHWQSVCLSLCPSLCPSLSSSDKLLRQRVTRLWRSCFQFLLLTRRRSISQKSIDFRVIWSFLISIIPAARGRCVVLYYPETPAARGCCCWRQFSKTHFNGFRLSQKHVHQIKTD